MPMSELKDGELESLDLEKSAINPFDELLSSLSEELFKIVYESGSLEQSFLPCPNVTKVIFDVETEGLKGSEVSSIVSQKQCVFEMNNYARKIEGYKSICDMELTLGEDFLPLIRKYESIFKKMGVEEQFIKYDSITILKSGPNLENPCVPDGHTEMKSSLMTEWAQKQQTTVTHERSGQVLSSGGEQ
ncbi:hypothetical protein DAPPUDRAFT_327247 [Daphnia pulex]|uniref:Uncharacterized protein n=1 Tax=Daphnia pulex TaxID=6669 RepID=E9HA66_DAPPU|nr:hypothetical protein DAPPUDRAFT_327247 [Daphnia pulex]|eukprot:EFX71379.1 hypothetical protein DAPPUDRAFT_327247 [Daphnia pulex]